MDQPTTITVQVDGNIHAALRQVFEAVYHETGIKVQKATCTWMLTGGKLYKVQVIAEHSK